MYGSPPAIAGPAVEGALTTRAAVYHQPFNAWIQFYRPITDTLAARRARSMPMDDTEWRQLQSCFQYRPAEKRTGSVDLYVGRPPDVLIVDQSGTAVLNGRLGTFDVARFLRSSVRRRPPFGKLDNLVGVEIGNDAPLRVSVADANGFAIGEVLPDSATTLRTWKADIQIRCGTMLVSRINLATSGSRETQGLRIIWRSNWSRSEPRITIHVRRE